MLTIYVWGKSWIYNTLIWNWHIITWLKCEITGHLVEIDNLSHNNEVKCQNNE